MPRDDTRPTGHRLIDKAALNGEVRRPGQTVRDGDVIAVGVGCAKAEREMMAAAKTASLVHGYDVVTQALACESEFGLQFLAWLQGREHAGRCEVADAGAQGATNGVWGGNGRGVPVPGTALLSTDVDAMLRAIMQRPAILQEFDEWLTDRRNGV